MSHMNRIRFLITQQPHHRGHHLKKFGFVGLVCTIRVFRVTAVLISLCNRPFICSGRYDLWIFGVVGTVVVELLSRFLTGVASASLLLDHRHSRIWTFSQTCISVATPQEEVNFFLLKKTNFKKKTQTSSFVRKDTCKQAAMVKFRFCHRDVAWGSH